MEHNLFTHCNMAWSRVPATEEALMSSTSCFTVHYRYWPCQKQYFLKKSIYSILNLDPRAMRPILSVTQVGENRNLSW